MHAPSDKRRRGGAIPLPGLRFKKHGECAHKELAIANDWHLQRIFMTLLWAMTVVEGEVGGSHELDTANTSTAT